LRSFNDLAKHGKSTQQEVLSYQVKQSFDSSIYTVTHSLDWSETQSIVSTKDTCRNHKVNASFSGGKSNIAEVDLLSRRLTGRLAGK